MSVVPRDEENPRHPIGGSNGRTRLRNEAGFYRGKICRTAGEGTIVSCDAIALGGAGLPCRVNVKATTDSGKRSSEEALDGRDRPG